MIPITMNRREDALTEALQNNEQNFLRWQNFLRENETAIENMITFGKRLTVDVMVPIGKKALMPGQLLHTSEVLVGHYQGYFSKCTTFKAKEICEYRIKMAKDNLKKLELEADLWQNKLDKPYVEGAIPSVEEQEIIEEFNEELEKKWKQEHRIRLKQAKQKEREERENLQAQILKVEKNNDEIFKMLEEAELMEELEQELDTLDVDVVNDETLRKLMSGELKLPTEKRRHAYVKDAHEDNESLEKSISPNIIKIKEMNSYSSIRTNNNSEPNPEISLADTQNDEEEVVEEEALPEEVNLIKQQAKYLNVEDQIGFYDYQIQIVRQKLQLLPLRTPQELNEKIHLLDVLQHLEEWLEEAEESVGGERLAANYKDEKNKEKLQEKFKNLNEELVESALNKCNVDNKTKQKRHISFALEDQTLEFRNHEAVTQMLPPKVEKPQRDIIELDNFNKQKRQSCSNKVENFANKKDLIQAKVEKNMQYVAENQSQQDFDMVQKILATSKDDFKTLYIKFQHSHKEGYISKEIPNTIGSPADIYNIFVNSQECSQRVSPTLFINSYKGEEQVKTPLLKETDRQAAFLNPKSEFSNPRAKSILRNKSAVDKENHKISKKKSNKKYEDDLLSAYNKVMNDVVEKPLTETEPLPDVKFIDAHTPKKRISHFKQMRQGTGKN